MGQYCFARWRLSSSVELCNTPRRACRRLHARMTSCRVQSNYSSTVTLHGGPVVLRPVRATPYFIGTGTGWTILSPSGLVPLICTKCNQPEVFTVIRFPQRSRRRVPASWTNVMPQRMLQIQPTMMTKVASCSSPTTTLMANARALDLTRVDAPL